MVLDVVQTIWEGFQGVVNSFLTTDNIFYIGIGFTLLMVLFFFIKSALSYECKLERSVNRLNEWLFRHQTLTESNLIEFNNLIKDSKSPKILRKHWQQFMLYRDKLPSEYISAYNCIDKPAKTSSFTANIKNFIAIYRVTAIVTLFLSLITFATRDNMTLTYLSLSLVTPVVILLMGLIFTLILRTMQNYNLASLYQTFHIFNRYIDKASVGIPKYVDFEILFTKKEIRDGIPILGEYLEKRARQEQEELEEAQRNAVSHEEYDFSQSGVDGSLVLERAMKESETYLNFKQRTLAEIQQFESEISTLKKNYENTSKDYQRKLQASKENMERLRQQQEESTNRIEVNYIRKQQQDEVKKQEQLEKDQEDATNKFNTEINSLSAEIEKRREDIEVRKQKVQEAMESEYQTFSSKLHKTIATDVEKASDEIVQRISIEKDQYAQAITYLKGEVDNKDAIIAAKDQTIEELQIRLAGMDTYLNQEEGVQEETYEEEPQEEVAYETEEYVPDEMYAEEEVQPVEEQPAQEDADGHYDDRGYYWFNDNTYYDADGLYHDLEGNVYDNEGNLLYTGQEVESELVEESPVDVASVEEYSNAEETEEPAGDGFESDEYESETLEFMEEENPVDEQLEENTEIAEESDLIEETPNDSEETEEDPVEPIEEVATEETVEEDPYAGHYDDRGYYWYNNKTYYDSNGLYHDLEGNVYDAQGNLQATGQEVETEVVADFIENEEQSVNENLEEMAEPIEEAVEEPVEQESLAGAEELAQEVVASDIESDGKPQSEETENKLKRRGRPRKVVSEDSPEEKPKRKAGRPRKSETTNNEQSTSKRKVGRPKKEQTTEEKSEGAPKRRGRPRKSETTNNEQSTSKRKVGRPKKEQTTEEKPEGAPKRRGRPRKSETTNNEQSTPKRKVGRPKKETETEAKPKRKAGRPRKSETENTEAHMEILKKLGQSLIDASEGNSEKTTKRSAKKS